jgi:hypothetical protein
MHDVRFRLSALGYGVAAQRQPGGAPKKYSDMTKQKILADNAKTFYRLSCISISALPVILHSKK